MADLITDVNEVDVTRMDFIVETVQRELAAQAKMRGLVTDVSEFALEGHKSISFPKLGSFSVQKLTADQRADAQALTATEDQLDLDQLATVQWIMKRQAEVQSRLRFEEAYISRAASAHAREVDKDILNALIDNAAAANAVTYDAGNIEGNILSIVEALDGQDAPEDERYVVFKPAQKKLLLGVNNFVQANRYGDDTVIKSGELGMAYGLRFIMSNITSTSYTGNVMVGFHREALAIGFQIDPTIDEQKAIEYGAGSKRMAVDQLYGVKAMQDGKLAVVVS